MEESSTRPSGLRPPSKLPSMAASTTNGLQEITDSQTNARSQYTAMNGAQKRTVPPPGSLPAAKRRPLVERAGSDFPGRPPSSVSYARPPSTCQGASLRDLTQSTTSNSNTKIGGLRQPTNVNLAASIGPGARPPSRSHTRTRSGTSAGTIRSQVAKSPRKDVQDNNVHDIDERVGRMDTDLRKVMEFMATTERSNHTFKEKASELQEEREKLDTENKRLRYQLEDAHRSIRSLNLDLDDMGKRNDRSLQAAGEDHKQKLDNLEQEHKLKVDNLERQIARIKEEHKAQSQRAAVDNESRVNEASQNNMKLAREKDALQREMEKLSQDNEQLRNNRDEASARIRDLEVECSRLREIQDRQKQSHQEDVKKWSNEVKEKEKQVESLEDMKKSLEAKKIESQRQFERKESRIQELEIRAKEIQEELAEKKGDLGSRLNRSQEESDTRKRKIEELEDLLKEKEAQMEKTKSDAAKKIATETAVLREKLMKEEEKRFVLFEKYQELKGNIRVMCRIKPPLPTDKNVVAFDFLADEMDEDKESGIHVPVFRPNAITNEPTRVMEQGGPFHLEHIFKQEATNADVFDEISQLVQTVLDGKRVCVFCYGQTGSGKTYTMSQSQNKDDLGIIPRTKHMIFAEMRRLRDLGWEFEVEGTYLQVYLNKLMDLCHPELGELEVDQNANDLIIKKGHKFTPLEDEEALEDMIHVGNANRSSGATAKNAHSSRSHAILALKVHARRLDEYGSVIQTRDGTLNLIDLAGSEKPNTDHGQERFAEGNSINESLSHLRRILRSLAENPNVKPDVRSSTLTQVLRPSLFGKRCRTLMFVMVSPLEENKNETIRSLEVARDARAVKTGASTGPQSRPGSKASARPGTGPTRKSGR